MKDYESFPPLRVTGAQGDFIYLEDGTKIIDAISSWWCKSLGHNHPFIKEAVIRQAGAFEHVILANTTSRVIESLSSKLTAFMPGLNRVFYGCDGSTAVEIALKMAVHAKKISGEMKKNRFIALENGYHGETALTLAVSDIGIYKAPYSNLAPVYDFLKPLPYINSSADPLWHDCSGHWEKIEAILEENAETLCAVIFEPVLQGAGGMLLYSPDFLKKLRIWTEKKGIYLIADEIMTGMGRTGKALACEHAGIIPDFICLSKGLTAGWLPMSAVLIKNDVYDIFYADYGTGRDFLHSNTYAGNALAAAAADAALEVYRKEDTFSSVEKRFPFLIESMKEVAKATGCLENIRGIGGVVAADIVLPEAMRGRRIGYAVYKKALTLGALLRPLGNTIYWMLPLNTTENTVSQLKEMTIQSIKSVLD